jgi:hypothetical protein
MHYVPGAIYQSGKCGHHLSWHRKLNEDTVRRRYVANMVSDRIVDAEAVISMD